VAAHIIPDLQALVRAVQAATSCSGVRVQQDNGPCAGQTVRQLHFHVVPVYHHLTSISTSSQQQQQQQALPGPSHAQLQQQQPQLGSVLHPQPPPPTPQGPQQPSSVQGEPIEGAGAAALGDEHQQGQLLADVRNRLPVSYSGEGCHVWVPSAEAMEHLGMQLQVGLRLSSCWGTKRSQGEQWGKGL